MENNLRFNSSICTSREQSERLLALGLKKETADYQYAALVVDWKGNPISNLKWRFYDHNKGFVVQNFERMESIPAWSLHRLIELLGLSKICLNIDLYDSPYEEIIHRIDIFINTGVFNREYLKE